VVFFQKRKKEKSKSRQLLFLECKVESVCELSGKDRVKWQLRCVVFPSQAEFVQEWSLYRLPSDKQQILKGGVLGCKTSNIFRQKCLHLRLRFSPSVSLSPGPSLCLYRSLCRYLVLSPPQLAISVALSLLFCLSLLLFA
jgi:hypothetical protein